MDTALFVFALLAVLAAPIFIGAFRPRYWFGLESAVFMLFGLFSLTRVFRSQPLPAVDARLLLLFLCAWLVWPLLQLVPLPRGLVALVSPKAHEIYQLAQPDYSFQTLSLQRFATADELLKRLMYAAMFMLMVSLPRKRGQLSMAVFMLAAFALMHGLYVFILYADNPEAVVRSTYLNRNHFALYIAMSLCLLIGYAIAVASESGYRGAGLLLNGRLMGVFSIIMLLVTVLMFTLSKGANVSLVGGMILTWLILRDPSGARETNMGRFAVVVVAVATVVSMATLGVSGLFSRFNFADVFSDERWLQWSDSLRLAGDYWLTGSGGGTYEYVFPAYKNAAYRPLTYHHVHNDYIEFLCNDGVVGLAILVAVFAAWVITMRRLYAGRRDPFLKGIAFGVCLAVTTAMVHAFFDFNLQVPANSLMLFALMGLGLGTLNINRRRSRRSMHEY